MALHPSWYVDGSGRRVGTWHCPLPSRVVLDPEFVLGRLLVQNFVAMPAPAFSRAAALRVGGLDPSLWYTADWDFWLKLAAAGRTIYHPRALAAYRIHAQALTMQGSACLPDFRRQLEVVLDRHLPAGGRPLPAHARDACVAHFSVELNTALASLAHGSRPELWRLARQFLRLGPAGWHRYFRDSRILERVLSRYRVGLGSPRPIATT